MFSAVIIAVCAILLAVLLVNLSFLSVGLACTITVMPLFVIWPEAYFILFLLSRPMADAFAGYALGGVLNPAALYTMLLLLVCGALLLRKEKLAQVKKNRVLVKFNLIFGFFLAACFASLFNSQYLKYSCFDFLRLVSVMVAVNYCVAYFPGKKKARLFFTLVVASSIVPIAMAAMQFIFKRGFIESGFNRVSGTFLHPNGFSQYLTMVFLVVFYLIQSRELKKNQRLFLYGYLGVVAAALFMTYTRAAWIGVSAAFMFFLFIKNSFRNKAGYFILAFIVLIALMPTIQKRFSEVEKRKQEDLSSWQWRLQQWKQTADFVKEDPLVGKGIGVFEIVFDIGVHNDYLRIAYETGFTGLLSYAGLLLYLLLSAIARMRRAVDQEEINQYKLAAALMIAFMLMSFSDNLLRGTIILLYYFAVVVYCLAHRPQLKEEAV